MPRARSRRALPAGGQVGRHEERRHEEDERQVRVAAGRAQEPAPEPRQAEEHERHIDPDEAREAQPERQAERPLRHTDDDGEQQQRQHVGHDGAAHRHDDGRVLRDAEPARDRLSAWPEAVEARARQGSVTRSRNAPDLTPMWSAAVPVGPPTMAAVSNTKPAAGAKLPRTLGRRTRLVMRKLRAPSTRSAGRTLSSAATRLSRAPAPLASADGPPREGERRAQRDHLADLVRRAGGAAAACRPGCFPLLNARAIERRTVTPVVPGCLIPRDRWEIYP